MEVTKESHKRGTTEERKKKCTWISGNLTMLKPPVQVALVFHLSRKKKPISGFQGPHHVRLSNRDRLGFSFELL